MARLLEVSVSLPTGPSVIGPVNVPNSLTEMRVQIDYNTPANPTFWPSAATTLSLELWISYNNGASYEFLAGITTIGGAHTDEQGIVPFTDLRVGPVAKVSQRKLQARVMVNNGPLVTQAKVEAF